MASTRPICRLFLRFSFIKSVFALLFCSIIISIFSSAQHLGNAFPDPFFIPGNSGMDIFIPGIPGRPDCGANRAMKSRWPK